MEEEAGKACLCGECVQKRFGVFFVMFFGSRVSFVFPLRT